MKLLTASLLLLSACAAPQRWPAALVFTVVGGCGRAEIGNLRECGCFAEQLERISPDPKTKATNEEVDAALKACGLELPAEPTGEAL